MNLDKVNNDLKYYAVEFAEATHICCEDGQYRRRPGYIVVNKETDVVEHTTMLLPGAIIQAQHIDRTLDELLDPKPLHPALDDLPIDEDVVAN